MKILVTGGGTAGHINPALTIASYIKQKHSDAEILYIGNKTGMEEKLVPKAGFEFKAIRISGFQRKITPKNIAKNFRTVYRMFRSSLSSKKLIKEFAPDLCIGTGGYVCGPVMREAAKLGVPCFVHESNSYPGVTVKMLAKHVKAVLLADENAKKYFPESVKIVVTGNPVKETGEKMSKQEARKILELDERPFVLSFGGSLGARKINNAIIPLLERSAKDGKYQHIHGYGLGKGNDRFTDEIKLDKNCENVKIIDYISNMNVCLAAADLVICRAGAMTITEISAMGKASVLIPSPNVAENHQYHNAMSLVNIGGAKILEEKNLNANSLSEMVDSILKDKETADSFGENARKHYKENANEKIYKAIMNEMK